MQKAWGEYYRLQLAYMGSFAKWWVETKLNAMELVWTAKRDAANQANDVTALAVAQDTLDRIQEYDVLVTVGHLKSIIQSLLR